MVFTARPSPPWAAVRGVTRANPAMPGSHGIHDHPPREREREESEEEEEEDLFDTIEGPRAPARVY
jgi:hypothetical protein